RSQDGGRSWGSPEEAIPEVEITDVKAAPDGTVYVGTRGRGILASKDGLRSWQQVETPPTMQKVRALSISGDRFLAGTEGTPDPVSVFEWEDREQWRQLGNLAECSGA